MPSNNSASRQGTMTAAAPTTKSNSNWLFYNRFIKKEVLFTIMTLRLAGNVHLPTLKSCCKKYFFKISLFKGILAKSILTGLGKCPSSSDQAKIIFIHATLWKAGKWLPGNLKDSKS